MRRNFFLLAQKVFVTNFLIYVTNFVTHITNFVIRVTNFVINFFSYDRKNWLAYGKNFKAGRKNYPRDCYGLLGGKCALSLMRRDVQDNPQPVTSDGLEAQTIHA